MKFCFNCGFKHVHPNAKFCAGCGTNQQATVKLCPEEIVDWTPFDSHVGYIPPLWTKYIRCECNNEPHATHETYCPVQAKRTDVLFLFLRDGIIDGSHPAVKLMCYGWQRVNQ